MIIRLAQLADLNPIVDIYNQAVALRGATADLTPVSAVDRKDWFLDHDPSKHPIWVAEDSNIIIGWCSVQLSGYRINGQPEGIGIQGPCESVTCRIDIGPVEIQREEHILIRRHDG